MGADSTMGDGSGIVLQIPHRFYKEECKKEGIILPEYGSYAVAQIFFPNDEDLLPYCESLFKKLV